MAAVGKVDRCSQQKHSVCDTLPNDSRHNGGSVLTDSLCLRVHQKPRSPDLAINVLMTDDRQIDHFTPCCAYLRGVINHYCKHWLVYIHCGWTWRNYKSLRMDIKHCSVVWSFVDDIHLQPISMAQ